MPPLYLATAVILLGGALLSIQSPLNAQLAKAVGSPINAALVSFLVGTVALLTVAMAQRSTPTGSAVRALPWYVWSGGLCGAVFVSAAAFAAPRLGVATMLSLAIASQLVTALALDHHGVFGIPPHPITAGRLAGMALVIVGVLVVRKY
ncbi:MAG: DMT family transporter [Gemmatimonadaceae bacterium]|nr:DMT family transporter [Gemmatimonadaceae bacterium]